MGKEDKKSKEDPDDRLMRKLREIEKEIYRRRGISQDGGQNPHKDGTKTKSSSKSSSKPSSTEKSARASSTNKSTSSSSTQKSTSSSSTKGSAIASSSKNPVRPEDKKSSPSRSKVPSSSPLSPLSEVDAYDEDSLLDGALSPTSVVNVSHGTENPVAAETEPPVVITEVTTVPKISEDVLMVLGDDPTANTPKDLQLHPDLASRWKNWLEEGLSKEKKTELLQKYPRSGNVPFEAPLLNPEIAATLQGAAIKRDKYFIDSQILAGSAMAALAKGISMLITDDSESVDRLQLLECLCDSGKLMSELHRGESRARRAFINPGMKKEVKSILDKAQASNFLYGDSLGDKIKEARSIEKLGKDLKAQPPTAFKENVKKNQVNWKRPSAKVLGSSQTGNRQGPYSKDQGTSKQQAYDRGTGGNRPKNQQQNSQHQNRR